MRAELLVQVDPGLGRALAIRLDQDQVCQRASLTWGGNELELRRALEDQLCDRSAEARTRIQDAPEEYLDYIYGEHDNGGYAILMIGPKEIAAVRGGIDFADSSPAAIARGVLKQLPGFAVVGAAALFGIYWFAGRRNRVMAEKARARTDDRLPKPPKGGKESNHVTA